MTVNSVPPTPTVAMTVTATVYLTGAVMMHGVMTIARHIPECAAGTVLLALDRMRLIV